MDIGATFFSDGFLDVALSMDLSNGLSGADIMLKYDADRLQCPAHLTGARWAPGVPGSQPTVHDELNAECYVNGASTLQTAHSGKVLIVRFPVKVNAPIGIPWVEVIAQNQAADHITTVQDQDFGGYSLEALGITAGVEVG